MQVHKILVFGDGRHLFKTICWVLEYKGHFIRFVARPEFALALMIEQDFDLVIAKLHMEDLQSLDVLKRAKKLNPEVKIMVVSSDGNAAFPLEAFQIEVDDYLLLPITPRDLVRRVGQCLKKLAEIRAAKAPAGGKGLLLNKELWSRNMLMLHDIRGALVSNAASLKLLKRGRYGGIDSQVAGRLQELCDRIENSTDLIDEFTREMFPLPDQGNVNNRITALRRDLPILAQEPYAGNTPVCRDI